MRQLKPLILLAIVILAVTVWQRHASMPVVPSTAVVYADRKPAPPAQSSSDHASAFLPAQAREMVQRIRRGGPFEHRQDGVTFGNYEGLLPKQPRGYYHEYTVETPGSRTRGARRIVTGGTPPQVWYYTDDHYRSFHRFEPSQ